MSRGLLHYVPFDQPGANSRLCRAACGRLIDPRREHAAEPTCERCRAWLQRYEALNPGAPETPARPS